MAKDTCLQCGKPLPSNKELASVPSGRLVAFDPEANRVWRICEECNHWHLLGPQAASAAMPELRARAEAGAIAGHSGLALVNTGTSSLLLFRVGAVESRDAALQKAAEIYADTGHEMDVTWQGMLKLLPYVAGGGLILYGLEQVPFLNDILTSDTLRIFYWAVLMSWLGLAAKEHFRDSAKPLRWLWLIMLPGLIWGWLDSPEPKWLVTSSLIAGLSLGGWAGIRGRRTRGIRWTTGRDDIQYQGPGGAGSTGWMATSLAIFDLSTEFTERVKPGDRAVGWSLWNDHLSLAALLAVFESRRDESGLLRFRGMTAAERFALLIAIGARLAEPPAEVVAGLEEAERVAAIAESLDRQLAEPA